jgi:hypothetical protein
VFDDNFPAPSKMNLIKKNACHESNIFFWGKKLGRLGIKTYNLQIKRRKCRAVGGSENPGVPAVISGHNLSPLIEIQFPFAFRWNFSSFFN